MIAIENQCYFYVGTYTQGSSEGIYLFTLDCATGEMKPGGLVAKLPNPSYLITSAGSESIQILYAVAETGRFQGAPGGGAASFAIDPATHTLHPIASVSTGGKSTCHLAISPDQSILMTASYSEGLFTGFTTTAGGLLNEPSWKIDHNAWFTQISRDGTNPGRQEKSHPHFVQFLSERTICVVDLGIDKVVLYHLPCHNTAWEKLGEITLKPGSGPRHLVYNTERGLFYILNELSCDITVVRHTEDWQHFDTVQTVATLPDGFHGENTSAALKMSADGRFLYASNRGYDGITVLAIDPDGLLRVVQHCPTHGRSPRDFQLSPDGKWLIAANERSDSITLFGVDTSGTLSFTGQTLAVGNPVCVC